MDNKDKSSNSSSPASDSFVDLLNDSDTTQPTQTDVKSESSETSGFEGVLNNLEDEDSTLHDDSSQLTGVLQEESNSTISVSSFDLFIQKADWTDDFSCGVEESKEIVVKDESSPARSSRDLDSGDGFEESKTDVENDETSRSSLASLTDSSFTTFMKSYEDSKSSVEVEMEVVESELDEPAYFEWGTTRTVQEMIGHRLENHSGLYVNDTDLNPEREFSDVNPLRELGVFTLKKLKMGQALTLFPGVYKKYRKLGAVYTHSLFEYGAELHFCLPSTTDTENYVWILDGEGWDNHADGIAHLMNSSHPHLPPPYDNPNVQLHEESYDDHFDPNLRPPLVIAQALYDIVPYCELLVDYHWLLIGIYTPLYKGGKEPLGSCGCKKCGHFVKHLKLMLF